MKRVRSAELKPHVRRMDFFCTECKQVFSVYSSGGKGRPNSKPSCVWCSDSYFVEKYSSVKHGCISGVYEHWTRREIETLQNMLAQPVTWKQIAAAIGDGKRTVGAVRRQAFRMGLEKAFSLRGQRPKTK